MSLDFPHSNIDNTLNRYLMSDDNESESEEEIFYTNMKEVIRA